MTIGAWEVILALLLSTIVVAIPLLAILTETTGERMSRGRFLLWILAQVGLLVTMSLVLAIIAARSADPMWSIAIVGLLFTAGYVVFVYALSRRIVRRVLDAGRHKHLAYLWLVPVVNLGLIGYLLWKPSAEETASIVHQPTACVGGAWLDRASAAAGGGGLPTS